MKKLLILAYDFPPYVSVGSLRPYNWYKYFYDFDIYPIVITRQWSNNFGNHLDYIAPSETKNTIYEKKNEGEIIRTPYFPNLANRLMIKYGESKFKLVRKIISGYFEFFQWLFIFGPKSQIYFTAKKYLKTNKVDVIIATGDPFILFRYANILSKKYYIPWIADYRDAWSNDISLNKSFFLKKWNCFFEKKIVKNALFITTVSFFLEHQISEIILNKKYFIITNGYDDGAINDSKDIEQDTILSIGFAGTIYSWHPIKSFLIAISECHFKININFYGINIESEIKTFLEFKLPNLKQNVNFINRLPNDKLLRELAKNNLMLLFNDYSYSGTKIFDYIGLKRKIILCYSDDKEAIELKEKYYKLKEKNSHSNHTQEDIINYTKSGVVVKDAEYLKELLEVFYIELKKNGFISCNSINTEQFSRKIQTKKLAELIKEIPQNNI